MKITLEQVLEKSNSKLLAGPDSGKKNLERNLERMKNWKKSQVEYFFQNGALKHKSNAKRGTKNDHKIITSSRYLVRVSLRTIIKEAQMKNDKIKMPSSLVTLAAQLISKENIIGKFKNAEVEFNV